MPTVVIPVIVGLFVAIKRHYDSFQHKLATSAVPRIPEVHHTVVVPVGRITPAVLQAVGYAQAMRPDLVVAVTVVNDTDDPAGAQREWEALGSGIPLEVLVSPYRDLSHPILDYIERIDALRDDDLITVLIPEFVVHHWWEHVLHNQSALALKARLLYRPNTAVTSLPLHL